MKSKPVGVWIAVIALLVNMPRFVLLFLDVDGIDLGLDAEGWLLGLSGIATGIVLSGGGAYIAHAIAQPKQRPRSATVALFACWVALLIFSVALLAPALVMAVRSYSMVKVLDVEWKQWAWSIVAVIAVEVLAGGAMVAHAVSDAPAQMTATQQLRRSPWAKLLDAASDAAVAKLNQVGSQPTPAIPQPEAKPEVTQPVSTVAQRRETLLRLLGDIELPENINKAELGRLLGVSRTQVKNDIDALVEANRLSINGVVKVLA
jgi:hypothetical protein